MTNNELKIALINREPVRAAGQNYNRIRSIIYTLPEHSDDIIISGECYREGDNSVTIHAAQDISIAKGETK